MLLVASAGPAHATPGRYELIDEAAAVAAVDVAIAAVTADLAFFMRPLADHTLHEANRVFSRLEVFSDVDGAGRARIHVQVGDNPAVVTLAGVETLAVVDKQGTAHVVQWREGSTTVQVARRQEGTRTIRCVVGDDGRVDLDVQFTSPQLPKSLRYRLRYRTAPPPP